jgi:molybdopterin-guanine dinucleotide biosynthesis protein A
MNNQPIDCLGVVLAGGLSSRMRQDKAQLNRQKKSVNSLARSETSMLDFSKQLLAESGIKNIVVSGDNHGIPDCIPQAGPVGGIYSVLSHYPQHLQPKAFLILPVDLPLMTAQALSELRLKGELSKKATFFQDNQKYDHHIPLYLPNNAFLTLFLAQAFHGEALLSSTNTSTIASIKPSNTSTNEKNNKNGPSVRAMLEKVPHQTISSRDSKILMNTNTPEQWKKAQQHF